MIEMRRTPIPKKSPAERAETETKAQAWRDQCAAYRASEASQGVPRIPSDSVMNERLDRHWTSANASQGFQIRQCDQASAKVNSKRGGGL